jgi:ABC-2 type transport system ATP-binding protein
MRIVDRGRVVAKGSPDELKRELHGDAIHVEPAEAEENGRVHAALARIPEVGEVVVDGYQFHARARDGARAVPAVLQALEAEGVAVASATVARPSLDDVYLRHAGRTFGAAEAAARR